MKKLLMGLMIFTTILGASSAFAWGKDCKYSRDIEHDVNLDGALLLNVAAGAGELDIRGEDKRSSVTIEAKLCAQKESHLADMDVSSESKDGVMYLRTEFSDKRSWGFGDDNAYIDLTVYVPANAKLDVADSSGEARVEGVASLDMVDSSGELTIQDVAGEVRVKDSSGALKIKQVAGSVWVTDSSGSIKVRDIQGDFTVEVDSSGSIQAEQVGGSVLVKTDSSGSIDVSEVGGDFTVGRDSSGGIYHKSVIGEVRLPD